MSLTKKQFEVLEYVRGFVAEHEYSPSYREIMRALDYKTVSVVAGHVEQLVGKGYLRKAEGSARSLEVVEELNETEKVFRDKIIELEKSERRDEVEVLQRAAGILGIRV